MKKIIALAALAAISATASAGNLLVDGSFESITQAPGTWNTYKSVPGWTVTEANGAPSPHGLEIRDDVAGTAENGHNFVELDGYENDKISQSFATTYGKEYQISFYIADRPDVSSAFLATSGGYGYQISSGLETISTTDVGSFGTAWKLVTIDFTALASTTKFSIWAAGTSDSYGTSFDNFQAAAVPEPATVGLFAAGLAMLGLSARRRNRQ